MRYRVTRPASLTGPVKSDYAYGVGDIVDDETAPEGHVDRLKAVGALEPLPEKRRQASAAGRSHPRLAPAETSDRES